MGGSSNSMINQRMFVNNTQMVTQEGGISDMDDNNVKIQDIMTNS